jgi:hypothetical protein
MLTRCPGKFVGNIDLNLNQFRSECSCASLVAGRESLPSCCVPLSRKLFNVAGGEYMCSIVKLESIKTFVEEANHGGLLAEQLLQCYGCQE